MFDGKYRFTVLGRIVYGYLLLMCRWYAQTPHFAAPSLPGLSSPTSVLEALTAALESLPSTSVGRPSAAWPCPGKIKCCETKACTTFNTRGYHAHTPSRISHSRWTPGRPITGSHLLSSTRVALETLRALQSARYSLPETTLANINHCIYELGWYWLCNISAFLQPQWNLGNLLPVYLGGELFNLVPCELSSL